MYALLLTMSLVAAAPAEDKPRNADRAAQASLDGNWTIVALEKDGQPVAEAKNMTVMVKGDTITCSAKDGKPAMTWKVSFADMGMVKVTATEGDNAKPMESSGVYVLTNDMLALCLHNAKDDKTEPATTIANSPNQKSKCSIILKRESTRTNDNK